MPDIQTLNQIFVYITLAFILLSFYLELTGPAFTFVIAVSFLGLVEVLTPSEILAGFANEQIMVIIMLLLLGDIIRRANIIEVFFNSIFKATGNLKKFTLQMMTLVAGLSMFMNNTPLVAVMMPYVHSWSKKNKISPSKLLIPLSFAAIIGGCATLIGTSTNLIVNGLVMDRGMPSLKLFDFFWVGFPMIIIGVLYFIFWGIKVLPDNKDIIDNFDENSREYIVEAEIRSGSHLIGKSIEQAGLRNLQGLYLVEIIRSETEIMSSPDILLQQGDMLYFAGETESITDFIKPESGLTLPQIGSLHKKKHTHVLEVVVSHNSSLANRSVKEVNFRGKYDAAIIAIHRNGERVRGKIGEIFLKPGDVLLLLAGSDLEDRANFTQDFYFISKVKEISHPDLYKTIILIGGTVLAILLSALGFVSLFMALICLLILLIIFKVANPQDLPKSIDFNLAIIIAMSLALGIAMIKTGVAANIATVFVEVFVPLGGFGVLLGFYFITAILAAYITNKAAVAVIFPIGIATAAKMGADPMPFILIVAYAAAANFMTPIGYQTNIMVYGPGGYSFKDFFRVGTPLTFIYMLVAVTILYLIYF
ncbi:MAG: potassium transporter TrkA [Bacteroidetes bacterium GWF2_38_335]|nr:MAG: potassium transporter TrkA [Bacteroidetes bacterium GWF2_38_335]OFY77514.1 MAG: potassium transporter TrkA [Bacteroidetes bacterium RIFOXYA12_FULL_38_20]HBS87190.1 SLC13 family permease [Bacteroidales bacterium]